MNLRIWCLAFCMALHIVAHGSIETYSDNVKKTLIETSFRAYVSDTLYTQNEDGKFEWYQCGEYKPSIFKVITKALVDCMLNRNEFENYIPGRDNGIIIFKNTNESEYIQANWNAILLYNYLAHIINDQFNEGYHETGEKSRCTWPENIQILEYVANKIKNHYRSKVEPQKLDSFLGKAVKDIHSYLKDLRIYEYLNHVLRDRENYFYFEQKRKHAVAIPYISVVKARDNWGNGLYKYTRQTMMCDRCEYVLCKLEMEINEDRVKRYHIAIKEGKQYKKYDATLNDYFEIRKKIMCLQTVKGN